MSKRTPVATQEHNAPVNAPATPESDRGKRGEEDYLDYLLCQTNTAQWLRMERAMADVGATLSQFLAFTMLRAYPGISNTDLVWLTMLASQIVSVIVTSLECNDTITRRPHAVHGRIWHIDVTLNGSAPPAACRERSGGIEWDLLRSFSPKEEEVVRR